MKLKHQIDVDLDAVIEKWQPEPGSRLFTAVERLETIDADLYRHEVREAELSQALSTARNLIGGLDPFTAEPDNVALALSQQAAVELLLERIRPRRQSLLFHFDMAVKAVEGTEKSLINIRADLLRERDRVKGFLADRDWQKQGLGEKLRDNFPFHVGRANKKASEFIGRDLFTLEEMFPEEDEAAELVAA